MLDMLGSWGFGPQEWLLACVCGFLVGFTKTGIGGVGILMVIIMADIFPARQSSGIVLPMLVIADIMAVWYYHRHANWKHLLRPMPWAMLGVLMGVAFMMLFESPAAPPPGMAVAVEETGRMAPASDLAASPALQTAAVVADADTDRVKDRRFRQVIGVIVLFCLTLQGYRDWRLKTHPAEEDQEAHVGYAFALGLGILGGFTTMVANAAGPVWAVYLLAIGLPKYEFIGTGAWFFLILNSFKVPFQLWLGGITVASLVFNAVMIPLILLGAVAGVLLVRKINQDIFRLLVQLLAAVAAIKLLVGA